MNLLPFDSLSRTALVIVDMQKFFFTQPETRENLEAVIDNINQASQACDRVGFPVVHAVSRYKADRSDWDLKMIAAGVPELIEGTSETGILPRIEIKPQHHVLVKTRYSAFFKTNLAELLKSWGVLRVITAGAYTHYCVNATVFDAYSYDFVPGLLLDAVISHRKEESNMIVERMRRNGYHLMTTEVFTRNCARYLENQP